MITSSNTYKAGYDPNYVTFFERIQADEKRRPGTIPKVFSTHPPTPDRIEATQKEIARILPNRPEYIVTTSELHSVVAPPQHHVRAQGNEQRARQAELAHKDRQLHQEAHFHDE